MLAELVLYCVAIVLELAGVVLTGRDIQKARENLARYLGLPHYAFVFDSDHGTAVEAEAFNAAVATSGDKTVLRRIGDLEEWQGALADVLDQRERHFRTRLESHLLGDLETVRRNADTQYVGLRDYVKGTEQPKWKSYRGLIVVGLGLIVGFVGNIVSAVQSPGG